MKKTFLIVSGFGRGHWLAVQLKRLGIQPVLLDVTEKLGAWIPEEVEGPFGFFYSDRVLESQMERLQEDDPLVESPSGFNLWLKDGPVELKGVTTKHRLEKLGVTNAVLQYLLNLEGSEKIKNLQFAEKWLALFTHVYSANEYHANVEGFQTRKAIPILSTFSTRYASRIGHEKSLAWVERQGVEVLRGTDVLDLSMFSRNIIKGIEYKTQQTESSQIYECDSVIWNLTSEETSMLGSKPSKTLYGEEILEPAWYWARYRIRLSEGIVRESLPIQTVMIGDVGAPWTHENFIILQKTGSKELFDVWLRLPNVQRFNKDYLLMRGQYLLQFLSSKMVATEIEIVNEPIGYDVTFNQSGPARHPIYDSTELKKWKPHYIQNIYFDSPEQWPMLGLNGMFENQVKVYQEIQDWWEKLLSKQKKEVIHD